MPDAIQKADNNMFDDDDMSDLIDNLGGVGNTIKAGEDISEREYRRSTTRIQIQIHQVLWHTRCGSNLGS